MKTCFVVLDRPKKPVRTVPNSASVLDRKIRFPLRSSCGISSHSPAGQSQNPPRHAEPQTSAGVVSVSQLIGSAQLKTPQRPRDACARRSTQPSLTAKQKQRARPAAMAPAPMRAALLVATSAAFAPQNRAPALDNPSEADDGAPDELFDRFKRVAEANINNVLGKLEARKSAQPGRGRPPEGFGDDPTTPRSWRRRSGALAASRRVMTRVHLFRF